MKWIQNITSKCVDWQLAINRSYILIYATSAHKCFAAKSNPDFAKGTSSPQQFGQACFLVKQPI